MCFLRGYVCLVSWFALTGSLLRAEDPAPPPGPRPIVATIETETVTVHQGKQLLHQLFFAGEVTQEKNPQAKKPLAKPFFFPLQTPAGISVTRAWPMDRTIQPPETTDHFHQKSAWFCHGDVIPEGLTLKTKSSDKHVRGVDFWTETTGHGRIVTTAPPQLASDGHVLLKLDWRTPDAVVILRETRQLLWVPLELGYLIIHDSELSPTDYPILFGDTKEGSFGVRVRDELRANLTQTTGVITSATGTVVRAPAKDNLPLWGRVAAWHDYSGTVAGRPAGIAILDHPKNPHPAAWHTRAYGLMAANPFARKASGFPGLKDRDDLVRLERGQTLRFRYALYVHDGDAASVPSAYARFQQLPWPSATGGVQP